MTASKPRPEGFDPFMVDKTEAGIRALATKLEAARQVAGMGES